MAASPPKPSSEIVTVTVNEGEPSKNKSNTSSGNYTVKDKLCLIKNLAEASTIAGILTILCFIFSLPFLYCIIWLIYVGDYECERILGLSRWSLGVDVGLFLVFLVSNVSLSVRARFPMPACFVATTVLVFSSMVGLGMIGDVGSHAGHKLPASPRWLKMKIGRTDVWGDIKHCIYDTNVCNDLIARSTTIKSYEFTRAKLSSLESGCCKPPGECEMEYVNATSWRRTRSPAGDNADCDAWGNNSTAMCFDCQACKDGFLGTMESKWKKLGNFIVAFSILLLLLHLMLFFATLCQTYTHI